MPSRRGGTLAHRRLSHHGDDHRPRVRRREQGFVAGGEVLPFGVLIFVLGTLLLVNAWAVIDAKFAVSSASREAART